MATTSQDKIHLPSYTRNSASPFELLQSGEGIAIAAQPTIQPASFDCFPLYGVFRVSKEDAAFFSGNCFNAVVVLIRTPFPFTRSVGEDELLFEDDLIDEGATLLGYFNLDLFEFFSLPKEPATFLINASIFHHLSNIVSVTVTNQKTLHDK